jgi:hypothetical protein
MGLHGSDREPWVTSPLASVSCFPHLVDGLANPASLLSFSATSARSTPRQKIVAIRRRLNS